MTVTALLDDLRRRRIRLMLEGNNIRIHAPQGMLTMQVVDVIRARKSELMKVLAPTKQTSDEAEAFLNELLNVGCTLQVVRADNAEMLIWFGPESTVQAETRYRILRLKPRLVALVKKMPRPSRRTWGEPTASDWRQHRNWTAASDE